MSDKEFAFTRKEFDCLREIVNRKAGIFISDEKFNMFYSRLSRRIRELGLADFRQYCELVKNEQGDEIEALINSITTNLTSFYRERHHFEYLQDHILPHRNKIRIWSAGCSSGEEPYTIAMTLHNAGWGNPAYQYDLLATDIDTNILSRAAKGIYQQENADGLSDNDLKQYFLKGKGKNKNLIRTKPSLQRNIRFSQLNLIESWQHAEPHDVIFCRNVLIYFDQPTKQLIVNKFIDALSPGGYLIVGHSESIKKLTDRIEFVGTTIYQKPE
jgi:chemotaxis protein methyltransferase CheR